MSFLIETGNFGQLLTAMTSGTGDCASVSWSMLGLSIPGWLLLFFIVLAGCCVMQLRRGLG
jgi:disulfide bond formation protein DsbB